MRCIACHKETDNNIIVNYLTCNHCGCINIIKTTTAPDINVSTVNDCWVYTKFQESH